MDDGPKRRVAVLLFIVVDGHPFAIAPADFIFSRGVSSHASALETLAALRKFGLTEMRKEISSRSVNQALTNLLLCGALRLRREAVGF
jgi:hypothetical protein